MCSNDAELIRALVFAANPQRDLQLFENFSAQELSIVPGKEMCSINVLYTAEFIFYDVIHLYFIALT